MNNLDEIADFIGRHLVRYGRISVFQAKEKYGEVRVYLQFGWNQIHDITHPGYTYSKYPDWLWKVDCILGSHLCRILNVVFIRFHKVLYRKTYKLAIQKWPSSRDNILNGADYPELLKDL